MNYLLRNKIRKIKYTLLFFKMFFKQALVLMIKNVLFKSVYKKRKPKVLQFPITYKCNYNCIMCGMRDIEKKNDFTIQDLDDALSNELFSDVVTVGVNGGEPFLRHDIEEVFDTLILRLPKLRNIAIISNGFFTERIISEMKVLKKKTSSKGIKLSLSLSLDGVDEVNDNQRGMQGGFYKTVETLREIKNNSHLYCDSLSIICTITKQNVYYLEQLDEWAKKNSVRINYNIATYNTRINNAQRYDEFTLNNAELEKSLAKEFLISKYYELHEIKYWILFMYLETGKRLSCCEFQKEGITIDPSLNLSYCATYSKNIAKINSKNAYKEYIKNLNYRKQLCDENCKNCSHYSYDLNLEGIKEYKKFFLKTRVFPII